MGSGVQNNIGLSLKAGNSAKGSIGDTRQQATKAVQDHLTSLIAASQGAPQGRGPMDRGAMQQAFDQRAAMMQQRPAMPINFNAAPQDIGAMLNQRVRPDYAFANQINNMRMAPQASQVPQAQQSVGGNPFFANAAQAKGGAPVSQTPQQDTSPAQANPLLALILRSGGM